MNMTKENRLPKKHTSFCQHLNCVALVYIMFSTVENILSLQNKGFQFEIVQIEG